MKDATLNKLVLAGTALTLVGIFAPIIFMAREDMRKEDEFKKSCIEVLEGKPVHNGRYWECMRKDRS